MKKTLILLFLYVSLTLSGATYYVAPNGNDSNAGTIASPWLTLTKAWTVVAAGDIIYMRGGTYHPGNSTTTLSGKSGTSGNLITISAYQNEKPIIDYAGVSMTAQQCGLRLSSINYVYFKGIHIRNMVMASGWNHYGFALWNDVNNCTFEQCESDHIGGWGFLIGNRNNNILFLNCDGHHNEDPLSSEPYGGSDGWEGGSFGANASSNITFQGCRAWANSDDGWDLRQADGIYTWINCWSFWNGFIPSSVDSRTFITAGNGDGYKLGGSKSGFTSVRRTVKNCIAYWNGAQGFTSEPDSPPPADLSNAINTQVVGIAVYNSTAYKNAQVLHGANGFYSGAFGNYGLFRNNIGYSNSNGGDAWMSAGAVHDHNAGNYVGNDAGTHYKWDLGLTITDADFVSVNPAGIDGPRQADGSLPALSFLHLAPGSRLIDAGVNVGLAYAGNAPDLGAFESGSSAPPPPPVAPAPVIGATVVQNVTPSLLEMTYDLALNTTSPVPSAYTVLVNGVATTVSTVAITSSKVQLTLSVAIKYGDIILVSYTIPATNPLQSTAGGTAIAFSSRATTNNLVAPPVTPPVTPPGTSPVTITMNITPNHVHRVINIGLVYTGTVSAALTPELVRITDTTGKLVFEQLVDTGATILKFPVNIDSGIYNVLIFANAVQMAAQRIKVY
jgi:hypothetical protein